MLSDTYFNNLSLSVVKTRTFSGHTLMGCYCHIELHCSLFIVANCQLLVVPISHIQQIMVE